MSITPKRRVYLDHASATPVDPKVLKAMLPYFSREFGNPSAIYKEGVAAKRALEGARRDIARVLSARPGEIVFTNGATESLNLALRGAVAAWKSEHPAENPEIIVLSIEHEAVLATARALSQRGAKIIYAKPDERGIVSARDIEKHLSKRTALVSVMYANNEIGTIQPIKEIGKAIAGWRRANKSAVYPLFHTDAVQAANYLPLHVGSLGVDLLTLGAGKIYGPKGIGLLYVRKGTPLAPLFHGGGQERGMRSGTENIASIAGLAAALSLAERLREKESKRLSKLRDAFITKLLSLPGVSLNGAARERLPNNVNISISGIDNELFVLRLDAAGVACSTKSACNAGSDEASHVIIALGKSQAEANSSLRLTLGRGTTAADLDYAFKTIKKIITAS